MQKKVAVSLSCFYLLLALLLIPFGSTLALVLCGDTLKSACDITALTATNYLIYAFCIILALASCVMALISLILRDDNAESDLVKK